MKLPARTAPRWMLVIAALALGLVASAQDAVMTADTPELAAPLMRKNASKSLSKPPTQTDAFFQFGPVSLHPRLMLRSIYGMGLPAGARHVASMIQTTSPGLQVDFGQNWSVEYAPTWVSYTARALENTLDHSARVQGAWMTGNWAMQLSENYTAASPLLIETGEQTPQRSWATQLGVSRGFGSSLAFSSSASLNERYTETAPDTRDWATMNWLTMRFGSRLDTGLGVGAGYTEIIGQPDGTNERYMGRVNWSPTDKLKLAIDGGLEVRHSRASAAKDLKNPLMSATLTYLPFSTTTIALTSSKTVSSSYFEKQVTKGSSWSVSLSQRLLKHFYLSASFNDQKSDFDATTTEIPALIQDDPLVDPVLGTVLVSLPGRSDRTKALNLRLGTQLLGRLNVGATYQRTSNQSSQSGFTFVSTQFGVEVGFQF